MREREGERGREKQPFCDGKLCKKWKRELQIYRRWCEYEETKQRKMNEKMNSDIKVEGSGEMKR